MSYQAPINEPSTITVRSQRIRNENSQSLGMSAGMKDVLITGVALGAGALGAYFLADYINKNNILDKIMGQVGDIIPAGTEPAEEDDEKEANIAYTQPIFDRTTRVNSYGNTGVSAYRGKKVAPRLSTTDEVEINSDMADPGWNQIFTEDAVYEVV